jgi:phage N-6-adenine-methyltransferase
VSRKDTKQDYGTPWTFIHAVEARFGKISVDLAASPHNAKADRFIDRDRDSLSYDWRIHDGNLWLNPEFANIAPWAEKAATMRDVKGFLFMLTPASIGSGWFERHVRGNAFVLGLSPRMTFEGMAPNPKTGKVDAYPKDLMLSVFGFGLHGFDTWRWT